MARYIHWEINFKSLAGVDCVVNIYKEGAPSDGIKQLTGGEIPVYWEEDDSDDLLKVVRTKSGYISFIEETFGQWDDVFPTTNVDRFVEVVYGRETVFSGYLQAQTFENAWTASPRELQIPIVSCLGVASGVKFNPNNIPGGQLTMGFFLKQAINEIGALYTKVVFPEIRGITIWGEDETMVTFNELIRTLVICPYNNKYDRVEASDDLYKIYQPVSVYTFIEGICNAYGWQVHETPSEIIFTKHDHTGAYLTRTVSELDSETGIIQVFLNSQITLDDYISLCSDNNTISRILPVNRIEINFGRIMIDSGEMDFSRCSLAKTEYANSLLLFRAHYFLNPHSNEFIGDLLQTGDNIVYNSTQGKMLNDGCYILFTHQENINGGESTEEEDFRGIMIQWSTAWSAHTNLCRVRLPYPAGFSSTIINPGYIPRRFKLRMHFAWSKFLNLDSVFHSDNHENFTIQVAIMNSAGKYWEGSASWTYNEHWLTVNVDGSTGDAYVCGFYITNQRQNDSLLIFIRTNDNSNLENQELILIDSIKWEDNVSKIFDELFERPIDMYFESNNGSCEETSVSQFITPYTTSENQIGNNLPIGTITTYSYMFESQQHLTIDSRHSLPNNPYLHPYTYQGRTDWKMLAIGFNPRNDEYTLILHTF